MLMEIVWIHDHVKKVSFEGNNKKKNCYNNNPPKMLKIIKKYKQLFCLCNG